MKINRWVRLSAATLLLLLAGVVYAWSILKAPLADTFGWDKTQLAFNYTLTMCAFSIGSLFSGLFSRKITATIRLLAGGILGGGGFMLCSLLTGSLWQLYLAYGIMAGLGMGILYHTSITTPVAWFQDRAGLCSGIVMMAFGLSTLLIGKLASTLMETPVFGWRKTYLLLGGCLLLLAAAVSPLVRLPRPDEALALPQKPSAGKNKASSKLSVSNISASDISTSQMLKRSSFYRIFILFTLYAALGNTMISFARDYTIFLGVAEQTAVTLVGLLSVCNGLGRLLSGALLDKIGLYKTQILFAALVLSAVAFGFLGAAGIMAAGLLGLVCCGASYGFCPTVSANMVRQFYGQTHYASNLSVANMTLFPASFAATLCGSTVEATGGYTVAFLVLTGIAFVGTLLNLTLKKA